MLVAWRRLYPRATGDVIIAFDDSAATETRRVALNDSTLLLDWHQMVTQLDRSPFKDFAHFNDWGSGVIAGAVARQLVRAIDHGGER